MSMNDQMINRARQAYRAGDFQTAVQYFQAGKDTYETAGEVDHLLGNSLMRCGRYAEAAAAYERALSDTSYGKRGALYTNEGKARTAIGDIEGAATCFSEATKDASYETPYKAYMGLGSALQKLGRTTEAGVAYRQAAIDGTNPAPAAALSGLGDCFVELNRPGDAIESYRTALDFAGPRDDVNAINAGLGQAALAAGRASEAVDAFQTACADGLYQLTPAQQLAFSQAQSAVAQMQTQQAAAADAGYTDPLDPLGKSGSFMPDPSDTGFFTLTESEMIQEDKRRSKVRRKRHHTVLKVFVTLLILVLLAAGGLVYAYMQGYGYPTQQMVLTSLFEAAGNDEDCSAYLSDQLSETSQEVLVSSIPEGATPTIEGIDRSMTQCTATVSVELSLGGTMTYEVEFVRDGLGWVVSNLEVDLGEATTASDDEDESTDESTDDASETEESADTESEEA